MATTRRNVVATAFVMGALAMLSTCGAILSRAYNARAVSDQNDYHFLAIEQFSRQWPRPDLSNYRSATGPGYHLLLAVVHRWITQDVTALRLISSGFTIALLAMMGAAIGSRMRWPTAVVICLPLLASLYVFTAGVWLAPDNLAWLTVLAALLLAYRRRVDGWTYVGAAIVLATAVVVRQINLWPLGFLCVAAVNPPDTVARRLKLDKKAIKRVALMLLACVPALGILGWFYHLWHGLTPPAFQAFRDRPLPPWHSGWQHEGPNFAVPAMTLAVLGVTGIFYAGFLHQAVRERRRASGDRSLLLMGFVLGVISAVLVPSDWNVTTGRYSGLWNISRSFPAVGHRSLLMALLAGLGGATVMAWFVALPIRERWIWLMAWLSFIAAQTANAMAWQKYYEPFCLIMLAVVASYLPSKQTPSARALIGPGILAVLMAGFTLWNLRPA